MRRVFDFAFFEVSIEDDVVVVLRDKLAQSVVFLQERDELFGGPVVGQFVGHPSLTLQELLKYFLSEECCTLPMPLLWQDSCT